MDNRIGSKRSPLYFFAGTIASLAPFATRILSTILAGLLISAPVTGMRVRCELGLDRMSSPAPGAGKGVGILGLGGGQ
jgi:hypothetical protein